MSFKQGQIPPGIKGGTLARGTNLEKRGCLKIMPIWRKRFVVRKGVGVLLRSGEGKQGGRQLIVEMKKSTLSNVRNGDK